MYNTQSGNVIFYVFIAVGLLGALSYVVAQSTRGGVGELSRERARVVAGDIMTYANAVEHAVAQLRLRGYSEEEISFENDVVSGYTNPNCSDDVCKVFALDGGGLNWVNLPESAGNYSITDDMEVEDMGTTCAGDDCADLLLVGYPVNDIICKELNKVIGITNPDVIPDQSDGSVSEFTGAYSYVDTIGDEGGSSKLSGSSAGCFASTADGYNIFYRVLIAR